MTAPAASRGSERRRPLAGVRVADFTWVWAGPFCTLQLAHLGAEVIRVETLSRICVTRLLPPWPEGQPGFNRSGYFNQYNQGKRSLALNLKEPGALAVARELVAKSDVVVENFAAGVMDRLGLGYETCRSLRPDVIMIALSGYGATGPEREYVSYGPAQVPLSGFSSLTGYPDWRPMHVGISYGDPTGGLHGAVAVLAALVHRRRTGEGQYIDLSQWEGTMALLPEGILAHTMTGEAPGRHGNHDALWSPHAVYRCAGPDRWVSIAVADDDEWRRLAAVVDPALGGDARFATATDRKRNEHALDALLGEWCASRTPEEVTAALQGAGVAAFPAMTAKDLNDDPHLGGRDYFVELPHAEVGVKRHMGIPYKLHGTPLAVERAAPLLGEDTDAVLRDVLGYDDRRIEELRAAGILT
ncbi:MAG TPA: CoA transferase [Candidatus Binatia bacterium]|nr:CoA transferase [Candidatus Binatia bacterium]